MTTLDDIIQLLTKLTGQPVSHNYQKQEQELKEHRVNYDPFNQRELGYSQFNELLLTLGYDRVTKDFFKWVFGDEAVIASFEDMKEKVDDFCKTAMLLYGHIKYAFKRLSQMEKSAIDQEIQVVVPLDESHYTNRHESLHTPHKLLSDEAYYLGYIVEKKIKQELEKNPNDPTLEEQKEKMECYRKLGRKNHDAYLVSDHMDVYIATSMRERYEFRLVSEFVEKLFKHESLEHLRLRYFDPTQAYCEDRIDKGLVEGLMIKRSRCKLIDI